MRFSTFINLSVLFLFFTIIGGCQEKEYISQETYYPSGSVESQTIYVDGKRDGLQKFFYEDGTLASQILFVDDFKQGEFKAWFHSGTLKLVANYRDGKLQGESTQYYEGGKMRLKERYDNGELIYQKKYTTDGKVEYEDNY
ncbi:MAG: hypothetical protein K8H86_05965 [Ignavibacteriaceae bacterium]|nr:hypothetical protein [Ignavibacteriaceae bacterium]